MSILYSDDFLLFSSCTDYFVVWRLYFGNIIFHCSTDIFPTLSWMNIIFVRFSFGGLVIYIVAIFLMIPSTNTLLLIILWVLFNEYCRKQWQPPKCFLYLCTSFSVSLLYKFVYLVKYPTAAHQFTSYLPVDWVWIFEGGSHSTVKAHCKVYRSSNWACTWNMMHTKIHLISPGCPPALYSVTLQNRGLNTINFVSFGISGRFALNDWFTLWLFQRDFILWSYVSNFVVLF